jgi:hypothetical protein
MPFFMVVSWQTIVKATGSGNFSLRKSVCAVEDSSYPHALHRLWCQVLPITETACWQRLHENPLPHLDSTK